MATETLIKILMVICPSGITLSGIIGIVTFICRRFNLFSKITIDRLQQALTKTEEELEHTRKELATIKSKLGSIENYLLNEKGKK